MKVIFLLLLALGWLGASARNTIYSPMVKTLQVVVNQDWLSPPVMRLGTDDVLNVGFDELSHTYHRFIYRLERCEADWSTAEQVFERLARDPENGYTYSSSFDKTAAMEQAVETGTCAVGNASLFS